MGMIRALAVGVVAVLALATVVEARDPAVPGRRIARKLKLARYFSSGQVTVAPGTCDCTYAVCDGGDTLATCGGRAELETPDIPSRAKLNSVLHITLSDTGEEACEVCGCNDDTVAGVNFVSQAACLEL
jgi:hypothetical protein